MADRTSERCRERNETILRGCCECRQQVLISNHYPTTMRASSQTKRGKHQNVCSGGGHHPSRDHCECYIVGHIIYNVSERTGCRFVGRYPDQLLAIPC